MLKLGDIMSVVLSSHVELVRARRELEKAFEAGAWDNVRALDQHLAERLNSAFDDEQRDTRMLLEELEKILHTYSVVVAGLPQFSATQIVAPKL